jgi:CHAD domain-containing protein
MPTSTGPHAPFRKRLNAFAREVACVYETDVEPLHRMRVASRRLREVLPVLGLDAGITRTLVRRLKKVTKQLGGIRELDVLMLTIRELGRDARYSSTALELLGGAVEEARVGARGRLRTKLPAAKLQRLVCRLERAVDRNARDVKRSHARSTHRLEPGWVWALDARATRRACRLRSTIETAGTMYLPVRLHDVRVALKKFRYSLELMSEVRRQRAASQIAALKMAQDLLGRLHDLEMLIECVRREQLSPSLPALMVWRDLGSLVSAVEDECRSLHARYMQQRSRLLAIADRFGTANDAVLVDDRIAG